MCVGDENGDGVGLSCGFNKGEETVIVWLKGLLNLCLVSGVVPMDRRSVCIVPLY